MANLEIKASEKKEAKIKEEGELRTLQWATILYNPELLDPVEKWFANLPVYSKAKADHEEIVSKMRDKIAKYYGVDLNRMSLTIKRMPNNDLDLDFEPREHGTRKKRKRGID